MSQFQFETIVKCIHLGAPALADELIASLVSLVELDAKIRKAAEKGAEKTSIKEE